MVMRKHQRYFPVYDASGALLPAFVTVANGPIDEATVQVQERLMLRPVLTIDTSDVSSAPITVQACAEPPGLISDDPTGLHVQHVHNFQPAMPARSVERKPHAPSGELFATSTAAAGRE